ncbi:MAG: hypothetical protein QXW79_01670 [Thermoplasmata archaeon]
MTGQQFLDVLILELSANNLSSINVNITVEFVLKDYFQTTSISNTKTFNVNLNITNTVRLTSDYFNTTINPLTPGNYYFDVYIRNTIPQISNIPSVFSGEYDANERITVNSSPLKYVSGNTQVALNSSSFSPGPLTITKGQQFLDIFKLNLLWDTNVSTTSTLDMTIKFELKNFNSNNLVISHTKNFSNTLSNSFISLTLVSDFFNSTSLNPDNYYVDVTILYSNPPISDIPVPPLFSGKNDVNEKIIVIYPPLIIYQG